MAEAKDIIGTAGIAGLATGFNMLANKTIDKAKILIADTRPVTGKVIVPEKPVSPGVSAAPKLNVPGGDNLKNLAGGAMGDVLDEASSKAKKAAEKAGVDSYNKVFNVQFNPASLNISGFSGGAYEMNDYGSQEKGKSLRVGSVNTTMVFSVVLVFDQMELTNSFPMESLDYSLSSAATKALKMVTVARDPMRISVQGATEGFIGAISNSGTRRICFRWGDIEYKGTLKNVRALYKMFDVRGRPVRSEVALSIYLADEEISASKGKANLGVWYDAYKNAFSDATKFGASVSDKAKKLANIVKS